MQDADELLAIAPWAEGSARAPHLAHITLDWDAASKLALVQLTPNRQPNGDGPLSADLDAKLRRTSENNAIGSVADTSSVPSPHMSRDGSHGARASSSRQASACLTDAALDHISVSAHEPNDLKAELREKRVWAACGFGLLLTLLCAVGPTLKM